MFKFFNNLPRRWRTSSSHHPSGLRSPPDSELDPPQSWQQRQPTLDAADAATVNRPSDARSVATRKKGAGSASCVGSHRKYTDNASVDIFRRDSSLSELELQKLLQEQNKKQRRSSLNLFGSPSSRATSTASQMSAVHLATMLDDTSDPLTGLLALASTPLKDTELKPETIDSAFSRIVQLIQTARTGTDFSEVCQVVRRLLTRTSVRVSFGLMFLSNADLQRRVVAIMEDTAVEFSVRLETYCHDNRGRLMSTASSNLAQQYTSSTFQSLPSRAKVCGPDFEERGIRTVDEFPIHLPTHHWGVLSMLVMVGRLLAEANVDFAVYLATNQLFSRSLARVLIEGLSFHAAVYFIDQSIDDASREASTLESLPHIRFTHFTSGDKIEHQPSSSSFSSSIDHHHSKQDVPHDVPQSSHLSTIYSQDELHQENPHHQSEQVKECHSTTLSPNHSSYIPLQQSAVTTPSPIAEPPDPPDPQATLPSDAHQSFSQVHHPSHPSPSPYFAVSPDPEEFIRHSSSSFSPRGGTHHSPTFPHSYTIQDSQKLDTIQLSSTSAQNDTLMSNPPRLSQLFSSPVMPLGAPPPSARAGVSFALDPLEFEEQQRCTKSKERRKTKRAHTVKPRRLDSKVNQDDSKSLPEAEIAKRAGARDRIETFEDDGLSPSSPSDRPLIPAYGQYQHQQTYPQNALLSNDRDSDLRERSEGFQETGVRTNLSRASSSVWEGTLSPRTSATCAAGEMEEDQNVEHVDEISSAPWTLDTFSAERARLEAMKILPRSMERFLFGSIFLDMAAIPGVDRKFLLILEYLADAEECAHLAIRSGLPLLDAILSNESLYQVVSASTPTLTAMLHLFARIIKIASPSETSISRLPSAPFTRRRSNDKRARSTVSTQSSPASTADPPSATPSIDVVNQQNRPKPTENPRRSLWSHLFRHGYKKRDQPEDICSPVLGPEPSSHNGSMGVPAEIIEEIKALTTTFLLKLGGSCKYHHYHVTDSQTRPMHFGIPVESLVAGNWSGRPTRGMLTTCNYPTVASLRIAQESVHSIIEFLAERQGAAHWRVAAEMSPLDALLVIENVSLVSQSDPPPLPSSNRVITAFTEFSHCCHCGKNCPVNQVSHKAPKRVPVVCVCNFVRYCNDKCLKADAETHQPFCHMVQSHFSSISSANRV